MRNETSLIKFFGNSERMKLFREDLTLLKMEQILIREFQEGASNIRIIGDLDLGSEDYRLLSIRLKNLKEHRIDISILEGIRVCIVTAWVFSLRYEQEDRATYELIKQAISNMPQYFKRRFIGIIESVFLEFGLIKYHINLGSEQGLCAIMGIHAGIPKQLMSSLFATLEQSIQIVNIHNLQQHLRYHLSPHMKELFLYVDEESLQQIFTVIRSMFFDSKVKRMTMEDVYKKYPFVSRVIIEECFAYIEEEQTKKAIS